MRVLRDGPPPDPNHHSGDGAGDPIIDCDQRAGAAGGGEDDRRLWYKTPMHLLFLFLQSDTEAYEAGRTVGRLLAPFCCVAIAAMLGGAVIGAILLFRRRSRVAAAAPPPSHYAWSDGASPDFAKMQAQQEGLLGRLAPGQLPESEAINAAARKLVAQDFDGAISAYDDVAARFPHRAADAHGQIGAAWFFKRDYDRALWHYRRAIELGAPSAAMEQNIREAEDAKRRG